MPAPTRWIQISERPGDQWVLPIWTAVNQAITRGSASAIPKGMSELALHLTTRLNMLPMAWTGAHASADALIAYATRRAGQENICRTGREAYALVMSMTPVYRFVLAIHSALYETYAAAELMRNFLGRARRHAGLPKVASLKEEFKNALAQGSGDARWCDDLETARGFFSHQGTAYVAVDVSRAARDLLLMKRNVHEFDNETSYLRYSELTQCGIGFERSKLSVQRYVADLYG